MSEDGRVQGDPTEVLTRSGGSSYVSLTGAATELPATELAASEHPAVDDAATPTPDRPRRAIPYVGWIALALAVAAAVITGIGVGAAVDGEFTTGAALAWAAIIVSGVAVLAGVVAVVADWGRLAGAIAIPLGLLANPFLLTQLLGAATAALG